MGSRGSSGPRLAAAAVVVTALSAVPFAHAAKPAAVAAAPPPAKNEPRLNPLPREVDNDRDKVFDNLETRLAAADADAKLPVIMTFKDQLTESRLSGLWRAVGRFEVKRTFSVIDGLAGEMTKGQIRAAAKLGLVANVAEDSRVHAFNMNQQGTFGVAKAKLDAPTLDGDADGAATYSSDDLVAAVVDTGIDGEHADLSGGKILAFRDFTVTPAVTRAPYDDHGHGTHVAGTIAGSGRARADGLESGVAPGAALIGAKVLDGNGLGYDSWIIAALNWLVANKSVYGIDVVNLSLGDQSCSAGTDPLSSAVNNTVANGIVVVVAAGNSGPGTCTIGSPGAAASAITVGAMGDVTGPNYANDTTALNLAYFSSRGPTADGRTKPDLVAPGTHVLSADAGTGTGYVSFSGTSMATPFVAGVVLLMRDANPSLSPTLIKSYLTSTATDMGRVGADNEHGSGRLNAYAALESAGAALGTAPSVPTRRYYTGSLADTGATANYNVSVTQPDTLVAAALTIDGWTASTRLPDFDLYLLDPNGQQVAASERVQRQEDVAYRALTPGTYTVRVVSWSGGGGAGSFALDVQTAALSAPAVTVLPTISGRSQVGDTVTGLPGTWTGWPTPVFAKQWVRCDVSGADCPDILSVTTSTHVVSASSSVAPVNVSAAGISGRMEVGETLTATPGTWRGTNDSLRFRVTGTNFVNSSTADSPAAAVLDSLAFTYQWERCATLDRASCANVSGATADTYRLTGDDATRYIRVAVTATARGGSTVVEAVAPVIVMPGRLSPPRPSDPPLAPPPPDARPAAPPAAPVTPPSAPGRPSTPLPDLVVTMTANPAPPSPLVGAGTVMYAIDVVNTSFVFASGIAVVDALPANLEFVFASVNAVGGTCTGTTTVVCELPGLSAGNALRVTITARVNAVLATTNTATASSASADADESDNSAAVTHP